MLIGNQPLLSSLPSEVHICIPIDQGHCMKNTPARGDSNTDNVLPFLILTGTPSQNPLSGLRALFYPVFSQMVNSVKSFDG